MVAAAPRDSRDSYPYQPQNRCGTAPLTTQEGRAMKPTTLLSGRGPGRPPVGPSPKGLRMKLDAHTYDVIQARAARDCVSMGTVIRSLIAQALNTTKED